MVLTLGLDPVWRKLSFLILEDPFSGCTVLLPGSPVLVLPAPSHSFIYSGRTVLIPES